MKIKVSYTIDIDAEAWQSEYGCEDVRTDVKTYAEAAAVEQFASLGLLA